MSGPSRHPPFSRSPSIRKVTMRRLLAAILVGFLATAVLVATPVSASATTITAPPPPVEDLKALPSQVKKGLTSAGGIGDENIKVMAWLYGQIKNGNVPTTPPASGGAVVPKPDTMKPLTTATKIGTRAAGGALFSAFTGGFALGEGGLFLYSQITGDDPLDGICGSPFETAGSFLYFGMMPDCSMVPEIPNYDISPNAKADLGIYGSFTFPRDGYACGPLTQSTLPSHLIYSFRTSDGSVGAATWRAWSTSPTAIARICGAATNNGAYGATSATPFERFWVMDRNTNAEIIGGNVITETPNPKRTPSCTVNWDDGTTTTGTGTAYTETDGLPMSSKGLGCTGAWDAKPGAGIDTLPTNIGVDSTTEGGAKTQIADQPVPEYTEQQKDSLKAPSITEGLKLWKGKTSCMTWAADCASWWSNTQEGTTPGTGEYRCTFNTKAVDLAECGVYRHTFDTRTDSPTITDPDTGEAIEWGSKPEQGNSINPGTGPGTSPGDKCMAEWSAAPNPIDWILHPVKCALVWAFVPRSTEVNKATNGLTKAWELTILGKVINTLGAWHFTPPGNGCEGVNVAISQVWPQTSDFRILNACAGQPLAPIASLSSVVLGIVAVLGSIWSVTRSVGGVVGFTGLSGGGSSDL